MKYYYEKLYELFFQMIHIKDEIIISNFLNFSKIGFSKLCHVSKLMLCLRYIIV